MSLEATIARAFSLNSIFSRGSHKSSSSSNANNNKTSKQNKRTDKSTNNWRHFFGQKQQNPPRQPRREEVQPSPASSVDARTPPTARRRPSRSTATSPTKSSQSKSPSSSSKSEASSSASATQSPLKPTSVRAVAPSPCHLLVEQILFTVGELEYTLIEDHQNDFELRMALERQTEKVHDLRSSLETERQRNQRLVQLMRGVDSSSSTDDDEFQQLEQQQRFRSLCGGATAGPGGGAGEGGGGGGAVGASYANGGLWQSRSSMDAFESISPLLMQQRYDELSMSHKQCRRQLVKKEQLLTTVRCAKEDLQGRYDQLLDEYRGVQKRFEELCCKYLRLQAKKNQEIQRLREALGLASDCVLSAQDVMERHERSASCCKEFRQNLQLFIKALRLCEWVQSGVSSRAR